MRIKKISLVFLSLIIAMGFGMTVSVLGINKVSAQDGSMPVYSDEVEPQDVRGNRYGQNVNRGESMGIPMAQEGMMETPNHRIRLSDQDRMRDFDRNEVVGWSDLRIMFTRWGNCPMSGALGVPESASLVQKYCAGDVNEDGFVNITDLEQVAAAWNDGNDEDKAAAQEIIEACRQIDAAPAQRTCLLRVLQDKEVAARVRNVSAAPWQAREVEDSPEDSVTGPERSVERRVENYLRYMSNMLTRMHAAVERLETLAQRIDSRITKLEEEGLNMSEPKELLADAQEKLESAKAEIAEISDSYSGAVEVEDPKAFFEEIKVKITTAKTLLMEVHRSLIDVIVSIKAGQSDEEATTTPASVN